MRAEIIKRDGNELTIKLFDELTDEEVERYKIGDRLFAMIDLYDPESITIGQRNHIYALFGDMAAYTGYPAVEWEFYMKVDLMHREKLKDKPSLKANQMSKNLARQFIENIVITCIQLEIPFRKDQFYLPRESSNYIFWATMNRNCVVCGEPHAHIHHFDTVGMGRNRSVVDHSKLQVMALCPTHHSEVHNIGDKEFYKKYLVKPVKLNQRQLKELGM